ncbi:Reverse transcriptase domain and Integrase,catalytic core domain and Ribonuclease H domain and Ribonuclease H-like domain-containing protein [Strongyloides ratti]|uniref:Reverse transcriptase domain and Integrase,catalytic core domain and Ribonuclease H domain and Ribonuclease H-like domain-containing protein n=1 Tax=Strongyloides ratti TaxID=34506 RepID=A0A090L1Y5_STRRB|nr:Reverse transcriptase domain and Integrase,catalytic core domain and Ribonuclease H domain and Ribonuclease H-like domain-containing protein [Strongyloides ratti]CEF61504.1 Reverse transcriptase domain and Integrase,catalytic core domain and Ribonuclease H domain and Ribonuclease H-like domain-containing protein [Strongyloides ratti]
MASPEKNPLPKFDGFPNKKAYVKLVKNFCRGKEEDEAIEIICNLFPKTMIESYFNRFLDDSFEGEMSAEELLNHIEEYVKEQDIKDTLWDKTKVAYEVRFAFGAQEACQKLLIELYGRFRVLLKGMDKKDVQQVVVTRFLSLVPVKIGREFVEKCEDPSYDEILKLAAKRDKKYELEKKYRKLSEEKSKLRKQKGDGKKEIPKGAQGKNGKKTEDREEVRKESQVKIAFFSQEKRGEVSKARVFVEGYGYVMMYLDSCSSVNILPSRLVKNLSEVLGDITVEGVEEVEVKGIHESYSKTEGAVELVISIPNSKVKKERVLFYVDKEAISPLLSRNFLKKFGINPIEYEEVKENKDFGGMVIDETSSDFVKLLKSMPMLYDKERDYEENVCRASFTVNKEFFPVRKKIIPVPEDLKEKVLSNIEKQVEKGWLESVPEGEIVENVNLCIPKDGEQLPSIKDLLHINVDRISVYDIRSAFNRINVEEECRKYLILGTPFGLFRSKVLVFGLKITPYIWMKTIKKVLEPVIDHVRIYYDDIVNIAKGNLHDVVNCKIVQALNKMKMQLNPEKCAIGVKKTVFLGYMIECPLKISIPRDKVEALLKLPCPRNAKEVMEVMGKIQYFAVMIPEFAELAAPVHEFKNKKGEFKQEIFPFFDQLRRAAARNVSLESIRENCKGLIIFVSISDIAVCTIMKACYKEKDRIFAISRRKLRKNEKNYGKPEKVLLGVKEIIWQNKEVAASFAIKVFSEVQGLKKAWESELGIISSTFQRLMFELKAFDLEFSYLKDSKNIAGFFKTVEYSEAEGEGMAFLVEKKLDQFSFSEEEIMKEYMGDKDAILVKTFIKEGLLPDSKKLELSCMLRGKLDKAEIKNGLIYLEDKLLIPYTLREKLVDYLHRYHASFDQMSRNVKVNFVGNKLLKLAKDKADSCETCLTYRRNSRKRITSWSTISERRERYHADCAEYGKYLFMINCDVHTGHCSAVPIKGVGAKDIISAYAETYLRMDTPIIQVADNGKGFCAVQTREYLEELGIVSLFSIPKCPESNGVAEKCVGLIKNYLKKTERKEPFKVSLMRAVNAVNERIVNGKLVKRMFLGYEGEESIKRKYEFRRFPFCCDIKYKLDRNDEMWRKRKCLEKIGADIFRITDEEEKNIYIRKSGSIIFLDKKGRAIDKNQIEKVLYQGEEEKQIEDEEKCPGREYIRIDSEEDFKAFRGKRPEFKLFLATDGSTERGKGYGGVVWKYQEGDTPVMEQFRGSKSMAASAQFLEVVALLEGLRLVEKLDKQEWGKKLAIVTDSEYVGRSTASYLQKWKEKDFKTHRGTKVQHEDIWKEINELLNGWEEVLVLKAAAHKGVLINEAADVQSKLGAMNSISRGYGHYANQCPSKKLDNQTQFLEEEDQQNIEISSDNYFGVFLLDDQQVNVTIKPNNFIVLDSGSSVHAFSDKSLLMNLKNTPTRFLTTADGNKVQLHEVLYVPQFHVNLLSLGKLLESFSISKNNGKLYLSSGSNHFPISKFNNMLVINPSSQLCLNLSSLDELILLHKRFGHSNIKSMEKTLNKSFNNSHSCSSSAAIKIYRVPHFLNTNTTKVLLHIICADLAEPKVPNTIQNFHYYLIVVDVATKVTVNISSWTRDRGIVKLTTALHTPEANPIERYNRTLKNMCGVILYDQKMDLNLWPYVIEACSHIRNRIYNQAIGMSPLQALGINANTNHLRIIGSLAIVRKPTDSHIFEIYSDANFSSTSKSTTGILVFHRGNLIHWSSSKQSNTACLWLRKFYDNKVTPIIYIDNIPLLQSIQKDCARTSKAKHVQVKFTWLKKSINFVQLQYKSTSDQLADFLTKITKGPSLKRFLTREMLESSN